MQKIQKRSLSKGVELHKIVKSVLPSDKFQMACDALGLFLGMDILFRSIDSVGIYISDPMQVRLTSEVVEVVLCILKWPHISLL